MLVKTLLFFGIYIFIFGFLVFVKISTIIEIEEETGEDMGDLDTHTFKIIALSSIPITVLLHQVAIFLYDLYTSGTALLLVLAMAFIVVQILIWLFTR